MKKFFLIVLLVSAYNSFSQVTFRPGLRVGVNFSHFTETNYEYEEYNSLADFYIGGYGELKLSKFYTLQPELTYSRQGTTYELDSPDTKATEKIQISYLSFSIVNKFTFNEKFNFHLGPTIDFMTEHTKRFDPDSEVDLAFQFGLGYNINKNIGIEARIKKGIVPVIDRSENDQTNVVFQFGLNYTFDVK